MNMLRKAAAAFLLTTATLCCGCQNGSGDVSSDAGSSNPQSVFSDAAFTVPEPVSTPVQSSVITYFGSKDISEFAELYKKTTGGTIVIESPTGNYTDLLSQKISSDASPDLCDKVDNTYPYLISQNLYEDLTNYIDTTAPQWADMTDSIEHYSFKGARYFYPTSVKAMPQFLIYVKSTYIQCGNLPDPEKLWLNNEWTWDTFRHGAAGIIESPASPANVLVSGGDIFSNFLSSTGVPIFSQVGSRFANGLTTDEAADVNELLSAYKINYTDSFNAADKIGDTVFISGDERMLAELRKTNLTVGAVPYPRYVGSDKYYCKAATEGFLVPKGAKNIQNAAIFINCSRIVDSSDEHREKVNSELTKIGLLRSDVEWLERLRSSTKMTPIPVDENCFDSDVNINIKRLLTYDGNSWTDALAEYLPPIDGAIEKINYVIE